VREYFNLIFIIIQKTISKAGDGLGAGFGIKAKKLGELII
jgi:hypothetical protein